MRSPRDIPEGLYLYVEAEHVLRPFNDHQDISTEGP